MRAGVLVVEKLRKISAISSLFTDTVLFTNEISLFASLFLPPSLLPNVGFFYFFAM